ncbi:hypothetical protein DJ010_06465 [Nocardioides silvaticus]|uniref:Lipoprotein n=1 Tax=Nocardioides silvaticus TaxID=2201891 RepID=A0A316TKC5_9ACTN|nr:hypothetical protein [Nocardioides silvaticus]PWN03719.1 hypothetical protein DJ010_06465 [Nocardioides silvaticus]
MRRTTLLAAFLAPALLLLGCGEDSEDSKDSDDSRTEASAAEEICDAEADRFASIDATDDDDETIAAAYRELGERWAAVEPPSDLEADAQAGFATLIDYYSDMTAEDYAGFATYAAVFEGEELAEVEAFQEYLSATC